MAVTVYDYEKNQWYVEYADGRQVPCHNRATAETLKRAANNTLAAFGIEPRLRPRLQEVQREAV